MNYVPDALSRMFEDEDSPDLASMGISEESENAWYKRMFTAVEQNPSDYPWWKIVHWRFYSYRPDHAVEDLLEVEDAWNLVLLVEKHEKAMQESHAEPVAGHLGRTKTHARVTLYYYWPSLGKDVADLVLDLAAVQVRAWI